MYTITKTKRLMIPEDVQHRVNDFNFLVGRTYDGSRAKDTLRRRVARMYDNYTDNASDNSHSGREAVVDEGATSHSSALARVKGGQSCRGRDDRQREFRYTLSNS